MLLALRSLWEESGSAVATNTQPRDESIITPSHVRKKTLEKFRRRYASVKGRAKLKPRRKARHRSYGQQLIIGLTDSDALPLTTEGAALFIPLPVFTAVAEIHQPALTTSSRGAIRFGARAEMGSRIQGLEDEDVAILMMLAA